MDGSSTFVAVVHASDTIYEKKDRFSGVIGL